MMRDEALKHFSRENYRRALEIFLDELENSTTREEIAFNANFVGLCLYFLHIPEEALQYFQIALDNTEGIDNEKVQDNIDEVHRYMERIRQDIEDIKKHLQNVENNEEKGVLLSNLGLLYYLIGKRDEAYENFKEAEKIFKNKNNKVALGALYSNFALLFEDMRQLDYLYRALDIFENEGHIKGQVDVLHALAMYYLEDDYVEEAYYFLQKEISLLEKVEDPEIRRRGYELAADIAMELGKIEEGMKYTEIASQL